MFGKCYLLLAVMVLSVWVLPLVAAPAPDVRVELLEREYLVVTPAYKARIGADGNLHALLVNGVDLLDDTVTDSAGASFFVDQPIQLPTITAEGRTVIATNGVYTVRYEFDEGFITLTLSHTSPKGAAYVVFSAPGAAYVENLGVAGVASTPADYRWPDVKISMRTGEYLELHGGSRIWGRALGRQVWERSDIAPNKEYAVMMIPGQGLPPAPTLNQLIALTTSVDHPDRLAPAGKPVTVEARFENNAAETLTGEMTVRTESSHGVTLFEGKKPFTCEAHQSVTIPWTFNPAIPDFYTVDCAVNIRNMTERQTTTFGYDVTALTPVARKPADFAEYWNRVTTEAKAAQVKLTRLEDPVRSTSTVTVYRSGMEVDGATFHGWLAVPKYPGRYPGLLILPSDRLRYISANPSLADCGFVVLSIEPTGQSVGSSLQPLITRASANLHDPATFGLRGIMVRYLQAVTALASVPEVDPDRLAVTGIGLGGGMSLVLAAIDDRIQATAPDVPFYCDIENGMGTPRWPYREVVACLKNTPEQKNAVMETLRYFDVANFTENITCPVLISAGIEDTYSRPANIYSIFNRLPGPRGLKMYLAGHEGGSIKHWEEKILWLRQVLGGPSLLPAAAPMPAEGERQ